MPLFFSERPAREMNLADLIQPVAQPLSILANVPLYVTGGALAVTDGAQSAGIALTVTETPAGPLAALELKDASAFALRNKRYDASGAVTYEQLPLMVTSAGRVLVNPPALLPDDDGMSEMTVFGGLTADRVTCGTLQVADVSSLGLRYVSSVTGTAAAMTVTYSDGTTAVLPLPQPAQPSGPPPGLDALQLNVDYLMRDVARLQATVAELRSALQATSALGDGAASSAIYETEIAAALAAVSS